MYASLIDIKCANKRICIRISVMISKHKNEPCVGRCIQVLLSILNFPLDVDWSIALNITLNMHLLPLCN